MTAVRWTTGRTTVHHPGDPIIFCPNYRRPVLGGGIQARLLGLFGKKAGELGLTTASLEGMPDHVHVFVKAPPVPVLHCISGQGKGYRSRILRQEWPSPVARLPSLWARSRYLESVGHMSEEVIGKQIADQRGK